MSWIEWFIQTLMVPILFFTLKQWISYIVFIRFCQHTVAMLMKTFGYETIIKKPLTHTTLSFSILFYICFFLLFVLKWIGGFCSQNILSRLFRRLLERLTQLDRSFFAKVKKISIFLICLSSIVKELLKLMNSFKFCVLMFKCCFLE